jgi:hypothetical protein
MLSPYHSFFDIKRCALENVERQTQSFPGHAEKDVKERLLRNVRICLRKTICPLRRNSQV